MGSIALLKLKSGKEIDFIEGDEAFGIAYELIQVSLSMKDEATRQREVSALHEAMARFEKNAATIITLDEESNINVPEGMIHVVPHGSGCWDRTLGSGRIRSGIKSRAFPLCGSHVRGTIRTSTIPNS